MELITQWDIAIFEVVIQFIATLFTVISGLVAAIWAVLKLFEDRRKERDARTALEKQKFEEQRVIENGRRSERVATLISEFSKATDPEVRGWAILALSLYPIETTRLLAMSLHQFSDEVAATVKLALFSIGEPALQELVRLNRIAMISTDSVVGSRCEEDSDTTEHMRLLNRTRSIISELLFHLEVGVVKSIDLIELDLSNCNFQGLKFQGLTLKKCNLLGASFKGANIKKSNFQEANLAGAHFLKASLNETDLTGANGNLIAVRAYFDKGCFKNSKLMNSNFDGASLKEVNFENTNIEGSTLRGAQLHGAAIIKARISKVDATKVKAIGLKCLGSNFVSTSLTEGNLTESFFERCKMMGMNAQKIKAHNTQFVNCNLGGANFSNSDLTNAEYKGCVLCGADFRGSDISSTKFKNCKLESAKFDEGVKLNDVND